MTPRAPTVRLVAGLLASVVVIAGFGLYAAREIRQLGDEQTAIAERNRLDSLQLFRIQNNLTNVATSMRDMADRTEPYPVVAWRQTFERLRADLDEAIAELLQPRSLIAADVNGHPAANGFARIEALRLGYYDGSPACSQKYP